MVWISLQSGDVLKGNSGFFACNLSFNQQVFPKHKSLFVPDWLDIRLILEQAQEKLVMSIGKRGLEALKGLF